MSRLAAAVALTVTTLLCAEPASAADKWHASTIRRVYPLANGNFRLIFDEPAPTCTDGNDYHRVYAGENGVNAEGRDKMYAASLAAAAQRLRIVVNFDDATSACYINRLSVAYE